MLTFVGGANRSRNEVEGMRGGATEETMACARIGFTLAFMVLFVVIDLIGSIPIIIDLKKKSGPGNELKASLMVLNILGH